MSKVQTGIDKLFKANATSPWEVAFTYNNKKIVKKLSVDKDGEISVGSRFREVLNVISSNNVYPILIEKKELKIMEMTSLDSFEIFMLKDEPFNIEISFRYYREIIRPTYANKEIKNEFKDLSTYADKTVEAQPVTQRITMPVSAAFVTAQTTASKKEAYITNEEGEIVSVSKEAKEMEKERMEKIKNQELDEEGNYVSGFDSKETFQILYPEFVDNSNKIVANDDRAGEFLANYTDTQLASYDYNMRIGDVILPVPPLSVDVNRITDVTKVNTLRSKNSMLVKSGSAQTDITLVLYFHDVDAINGRQVVMQDKLKGEKHYYYLDGLRTLISQFKHVPFVPIDNAYLNETHDIQSVSLKSLVVETVPDFPNCLSATLTLSKFEHQTYLPKAEFLGEVINYPLMRWYIQRSMGMDAPEDYTKTFLKPIKGQLKNDFKFLMADEEQLNTASEAVLRLRSFGTNSYELKTNFESPSTSNKTSATDLGTKYGRIAKDGDVASKILAQYSIYQQLISKGELKYEEKYADFEKRIVSSLNPYGNPEKFFSIYFDEEYKEMYYENTFAQKGKEYNEAKKQAEEEAIKKNKGRTENLYTWEDFIGLYYTREYEVNAKFNLASGFYPVESEYVFDLDYYMHKNGTKLKYRKSDIMVIRLYDELDVKDPDAKILKEFEVKALATSSLKTYVVPVNSLKYKDNEPEARYLTEWFTLLNKLKSKGLEATSEYEKALDEYEELKQIVVSAENGISMKEVDLVGKAVIKTMKVVYENNFSSFQQQAMEQPTLQFLGGNDSYIHLTLRMEEEAVEALSKMLVETDRFAREYRRGISTGFLEMENDLLQLFGVKAIMPEISNIRTVEGYPGQYDVEMTFYSFNKSQKKQETVQGMSSINVNDKSLKESRSFENTDSTKDYMLIEAQLKDMEIYPDLELPTYEEVIDALRWINAGFDNYTNNGGAKFVDPDFYIYTPDTIRKLIYETKETPTSALFQDENGISFKTSSISESKNGIVADDENREMMNLLSQAAPLVSSAFSWGDEDITNEMESDASDSYKSEEVYKFVSDNDKLKKRPSYKEWSKWKYPKEKVEKKVVITSKKDKNGKNIKEEIEDQPHIRQYSEFLENMNPNGGQVYKKIKELNRKYLSDLYTNNTKNVAKKGTAQYAVTYASIEEIRKAKYNSILSKNVKKLSKKKKEKLKGLKQSQFTTTKNLITEERWINYVRSMLDVISNWKQVVDSKNPIIDGNKNRVGIMGVSLMNQANDVNEAKRLIWDWEYNMERGYEVLSKRLKDVNEKSNEIEYASQPWDWIIQGYGSGKIKDTLNKTFYMQVASVFENKYNSVEARFSTATEKFNSDILGYTNTYTTGKYVDYGMTTIQKDLIQLDKPTLINELVSNLGYIDKSVKNKKSYTTADKKAATKKKLNDLGAGEVAKLYEERANTLFDRLSADLEETGVTLYTGVNSDLKDLSRTTNSAMEENKKKYKDAYENWIIYKRYKNQYLESTDQSMELPTIRNEKEIFKDMWLDELRYDQRFRLIRAFPTFYMFFIDEGKWMGSYRVWDNVYGYNAIQEIDVYRSRKIAADTVKLKVSNVYSNITSIPSTYTSDSTKNYKIWDNLLLRNPTQSFIDARKQLSDRIILQTGARMQLRLGYGSSANDLPIIFNGTITEMDLSETMEIVAQGDAIELGNVIPADPEDSTKNLFKTKEPREMLCGILATKGNWFKDAINIGSGNRFYKDAASGIQHYGKPTEAVGNGLILPFNDDYGEIGINIYSSIGLPIRGEWEEAQGSIKEVSRNNWSVNDDDGTNDDLTVQWTNPYRSTFHGNIFDKTDQNDIELAIYGNTHWDIGTTMSYIFPDYIFTSHPFETRSTVFFGKPQWEIVYGYNGTYEKTVTEDGEVLWNRSVTTIKHKPYAQAHFFDIYQDMIYNGIRASADDLYTNAMVTCAGKSYGPIYADYDINFAMHKTALVDSIIVGGKQIELQALYYASSTIRDSLRDMYKGQFLVIGNPTVKPYDICYIKDDFNDMSGAVQVKAVHHNFSQTGGFTTSIEPDLLVSIDDIGMMRLTEWVTSMAITMVGSYTAALLLKRSARKLWRSNIVKNTINTGKLVSEDWLDAKKQKMMKDLASKLPEDTKEGKEIKKAIKDIHNKKKPVKGANMTPEQKKQYKKDLEKYNKDMKGMHKELSVKQKALDEKALKLKDDFAKLSADPKTKAKDLEKAREAYKKTKKLQIASKTFSSGVKTAKTVGTVARFLTSGTVIGFAINVGLFVISENMVESHRRKKAQYQCCIIQPLMFKGQSFEAGINGHAGLVKGEPLGFYDKVLRGVWDDSMEQGYEELDGLSILSIVPKASAKYNAFLENGLIDGITGLWNWNETDENEAKELYEEDGELSGASSYEN